MITPEEFYEEQRQKGKTYQITSNDNLDYFLPFYQEIFDLMAAYANEVSREVAIKQRLRDRAVYSINRAETSIKIRQAILDAPLVTESNQEDK